MHWVASNATPVAIKMFEIERQSVQDNTIQAVNFALRENYWTEKAMQFKKFST